MVKPASPSRSATDREIIDQAISENRINEWLLYGFAVTFVLAGGAELVWGIVLDRPGTWVRVVCTSLFIPAMYLAERIRKQNLALRTLEIPLREAKTADQAAKILNDFFVNAFAIKKK